MKAQGRSRRIAPLIINSGTRCVWFVKATSSLLYLREWPPVRIYGKLRGLHYQSGRCEEKKISFPHRGSNLKPFSPQRVTKPAHVMNYAYIYVKFSWILQTFQQDSFGGDIQFFRAKQS